MIPECPCCGGDGIFLGALGNRCHYRCRDCGIDYSRPYTPPPADDSDDTE